MVCARVSKSTAKHKQVVFRLLNYVFFYPREDPLPLGAKHHALLLEMLYKIPVLKKEKPFFPPALRKIKVILGMPSMP